MNLKSEATQAPIFKIILGLERLSQQVKVCDWTASLGLKLVSGTLLLGRYAIKPGFVSAVFTVYPLNHLENINSVCTLYSLWPRKTSRANVEGVGGGGGAVLWVSRENSQESIVDGGACVGAQPRQGFNIGLQI